MQENKPECQSCAVQQGVPPAIMPKGESAAAQLRAMATNYPAGHNWDKLDASTCIRGALEIEALRALLATAPAHPAEGVPAPATVVDALQSLIEAIQFTPLGVRQIHAMERAREALKATHPTQQGLEQANCKSGKWFTVVYRDIHPGDEARAIGEHPKASALSWSHALNDRDTALAAQAKQGGV